MCSRTRNPRMGHIFKFENSSSKGLVRWRKVSLVYFEKNSIPNIFFFLFQNRSQRAYLLKNSEVENKNPLVVDAPEIGLNDVSAGKTQFINNFPKSYIFDRSDLDIAGLESPTLSEDGYSSEGFSSGENVCDENDNEDSETVFSPI